MVVLRLSFSGQPAAWYGPSERCSLFTTPGIHLRNINLVPPSSILLRWYIQCALDRCRRGGHTTGEDWLEYLEAPFPVLPETTVAYSFVYPTCIDAVSVQLSGESQSSNISSQMVPTGSHETIIINSGKRKGFELDLDRRRNAARINSLPKSTAPPKYCAVPHPLMKLSRSALPAEATDLEWENAVSKFSCSVSKETQNKYATVARHLHASENKLGRKFSIPPTNSEQIYLIGYLQSRGIKANSISSYMSGLGYYNMAQGVAEPPKLSSLASQIIAGGDKANINARLEAEKKTRRAITLDMLKLLEHSVAIRQDWS